ncbi:hypothetical protein STEG23_002812, partial [Scotinomys teguina]
MIFRAAPPAEHERRKCRGAAFSVPAVAPAGYITRHGAAGGPAVPRPASQLPQDALSPATPSAAAGSRPSQSTPGQERRKHPQNDGEIQPDVVTHANWIPVFEGQRLVDL